MLVKIPSDGIPPKDCILYFTASWCSPCKAMKPVIASSKTEVIEIDVNYFPGTARTYTVTGLPTLIRIKGGKEVVRMSGSKTSNEIRRFLEWENK